MSIFEKLFFDEEFDSINNIVRWNGVRRIKDETVGQHSFIVSVFVNYLVEEIFITENLEIITFKLRSIQSSIGHDMDEMITGDVIHTVKNNSLNGKAISESLDQYIETAINGKLEGSGEKASSLFKNTISYFNDGDIKAIVKVGDWLSALYYIFKEKKLGNQNFKNEWPLCLGKGREAIKHAKESMEKRFPECVNISVFTELLRLTIKLSNES